MLKSEQDTLVSGNPVPEHLVLHLLQSVADIGTGDVGATQKCGGLYEAPPPLVHISLYRVQHLSTSEHLISLALAGRSVYVT